MISSHVILYSRFEKITRVVITVASFEESNQLQMTLRTAVRVRYK